jgi:hypothetical protein
VAYDAYHGIGAYSEATFPVLRPVLPLLQDESPVLENLTVQDIVSEALPAPVHPAALEAYRKLGLLK